MKRLALLAIFAGVVSVFAAASKAPWKWTDDERLNARFDPHSIADRAAAYRASQPPLGAAVVKGPAVVYVLDGGRNPELFMPHELFDALVRGAFVADPAQAERYRQSLAPDLQRAALTPKPFWSVFEEITRPYVALQQRSSGHGHGRSEDEALCHVRFLALQNARQRFGAERFDSLLYTAIAPFIVQSGATTFPNPAERLRREAEGCQ